MTEDHIVIPTKVGIYPFSIDCIPAVVYPDIIETGKTNNRNVIPTKVGIYSFTFQWIPAFAGMTRNHTDIPVQTGISFLTIQWLPAVVYPDIIGTGMTSKF